MHAGLSRGQVLRHSSQRPFSSVRFSDRRSLLQPGANKILFGQHKQRIATNPVVKPDTLSLLSTSPDADKALALLDATVSHSDEAVSTNVQRTLRGTLETPEQLASTTGHRAIVTVAFGILALIAAEGIAGLHGTPEALGAASSVFIAFVLAGQSGTKHNT